MKIPAGQIETIRNAIETLIKQPLNQPVESIAAADLSAGAGDMDQLVAALGQLVDIMTRVEADRGASETMTPGADSDLEITEIGEYGFGLYQNLASRATDAEQKTAYSNLAIDLALWIARHNGQIDTLEPVVDALAQLANSAHNPQELTTLGKVIERISDAISSIIRQDLDKSNPGRPWRILLLNRAIIATRSHDPDTMGKAFEVLTNNLPEEAAQFFNEGMQQMDALNYPQHVREVMEKHHSDWSRKHSLH